MNDSEEGLMRRCRAGDSEAFGEVVKSHAGRAIGAACLLLGNYDDALDASQEAFIRAWRNIRRFEGKGSFHSWYSAILRNVCVSRIRRRRRNPVQLADDRLEAGDQFDPAKAAECGEQADRLCRAIVKLPFKQRQIIVMKHFQEMSYKQIAGVLDVPIGTVMSRLHGARKALREELAGEAI